MTPLQKSILNAVKRRPMTLRELQNNLQVDNSRLRTTVSAMVATGELSMRNGTYVPGFATYENAAAPNTIPCTLVKLAARFGFASRDDGEGDIFIPGRALHGAMPNDKINVKLFDHPRVEGSSEGEVVEVTVPNNRFAGTVCLSEDGRMAVEPDGCRDVKFLLAKQGSEGVHLGDKVGFLITHRGNRHSDHRAAVVEKFGSSDYASECAKAILRWVEHDGLTSFTARSALEKVKGRWPRMDKVNAGLHVLEDWAYIAPLEPETGKRGRPTRVYMVNPQWRGLKCTP